MPKEVLPGRWRFSEYWPSTAGHRIKPVDLKQRGVFSDDIIRNLKFKIHPDDQERPSSCSFGDWTSPEFSPVKVDFCKLTDYFSSVGDRPKVQIPHGSPGPIPRRVAVERLRRKYMKVDLEELLSKEGVDIDQLIPKSFEGQTNTSSAHLPLEMFDDEDFDCRSPEDWLALGRPDGSLHHKPVPAKALLPVEAELFDASSSSYRWQLVGVLDFCVERRQYLVEKIVLDHDGGSGVKKTKRKVTTRGRHWVPRVRLLFCAEDPHVFVQRLQFALCFREDTKAVELNELCVDRMPAWEGSPSLDADALQRIMKKAASASGLSAKMPETRLQELEKEVKLQHDRTMNTMVFDSEVKSSAQQFSCIKQKEYFPLKGPVVVAPQLLYLQNKKSFSSKSLLNKSEAIVVLTNVRSRCNKVSAMKLFNVSSNKPLRLEEFRGNQAQLHTQTSLFLHESWVPTLCHNIRRSFGNTSKGDFNLQQTSWETFKTSRLHRLMVLVRLHMQDALRQLVSGSVLSLGRAVLDACACVRTCPPDMVWGDDLINSPFRPTNQPLFLVDLVLDESEAHYSSPVDTFQTSVTHLFHEGVLSTHNIPQLEKFVLPNLYFGGDPVVASVCLWEAEVVELRDMISDALSRAAAVLKAYAAEYSQFIHLHNMDVNSCFQSHAEGCQTSQEVKKEVERHLREKERLETLLPSSLVVGPFLIRVESVRQNLCNKTKALAEASLKHFASTLRRRVDDVCVEYDNIHKTLHKKPENIEELSEKKIWIKQLQDQLEMNKESLVKILWEYELLHEFCHTVPREDANKKLAAMVWPMKISTEVQAVSAQNVELEDHFHKILLSDQNHFEEHLDSLQELVASLSAHVDVDDARDVLNKVRRAAKILHESQTSAQTFNHRERLLGAAVTSYDRLATILADLQPFRDLWTTTFDWIYWHEIWLRDPLTSIDPETLQENVSRARPVIAACIDHFSETPGCQMVATQIHSKIRDFEEHVPLIRGLRNPGMRERHWETLAERTGITLVPPTKLTFSCCLELGLQTHKDAVAQVVQEAERELEVEQSLESMKNVWSTVHLDVKPHQESDLYRLQVSDDMFSLLQNQLVATQNLSASPFKEPFEEQIHMWELQLRYVQEVLDQWRACQSLWVSLEPAFTSQAVNQTGPEARMQRHVVRVWRRIMRSAFNHPKVMDLCSEDSLLDELKLCRKVLRSFARTEEKSLVSNEFKETS